jgi:ribosomal protein S18 acetylase RimI-like enzyme
MSQDIQVRAASDADLVFAFDEPRIPRAIQQRMIAEGDVLIAEIGGVPVGFLRLERIWGKLPFIALIRVLPDHQRHGVGSALLRHLEAQLRAQGQPVLYSSSEASAAAAQAWHRQQSFVECGFIAGINPGGVGEVFFRKVLEPSDALR